MKTTVEISDPLLGEARKVAESQSVTLPALIERGLHQVVEESGRSTPFQLRRATFEGDGLKLSYRDASWARMRGAIYETHGP